jgi:hypothetical protein
VVVERRLAWFLKCGTILGPWDKRAANYFGPLELACVLLWFRRELRFEAP